MGYPGASRLRHRNEASVLGLLQHVLLVAAPLSCLGFTGNSLSQTPNSHKEAAPSTPTGNGDLSVSPEFPTPPSPPFGSLDSLLTTSAAAAPYAGTCGEEEGSFSFTAEFAYEHPLATPPASAIQLYGTYALVLSEGYLLTLDVSNTSQPTPASMLVPPYGLVPKEELMAGSVVTSGSSSDNSSPDEGDVKSSDRRRGLLGSVEPASSYSYNVVEEARPAAAMALSGRHAYVTSWEYSRELEDESDNFSVFSVVDISDLEAPQVVGALDVDSMNSTDRTFLMSVCDVKVSGLSAYLALRNGGLAIVNISNPASPTLESLLSVNNVHNFTVTAVDVSGMYAYLTFHNEDKGGMVVVDVSSAQHPSLLSTLILPDLQGARDVQVVSSVAYVVTQNGITSLDVSKGQLAFRSALEVPTMTLNSKIRVVETKGYVTGGNQSVAVVDLVSPVGNGLSIIAYLEAEAIPSSGALWVSSKSVFVGGQGVPLTILDASTCQGPIWYYPPPLSPFAPWIENINDPSYKDYNSVIPLYGAAALMMGQYLLAAYIFCFLVASVSIALCFRDRVNFARFLNHHRRRFGLSSSGSHDSTRLLKTDEYVKESEMIDLESGLEPHQHLKILHGGHEKGLSLSMADIPSCSQSPVSDEVSKSLPAYSSADRFEICPDDIDWGAKAQRVGVGAYGEVFKAKWGGTTVAVKRLFPQDLDEQTTLAFRREVKIMGSLRHPHIVLWLGACTQPSRLIIVSEFMEGGSLHRLLHKDKREVSMALKLRLCLQIARGLAYLHDRAPPIIHRDLSSANVLLDRSLNAKISDFGLSRVKMSSKNKSGSAGGTAEYQPPEVLRSHAYDELADSYAFGVLVWEVFTRLVPWRHKGMISVQVVAQVVVHGTDATVESLEIPPEAPEAVRALVLRCWKNRPDDRPAARECVRTIEEQLRIVGADLRRLASDSQSNSSSKSQDGGSDKCAPSTKQQL